MDASKRTPERKMLVRMAIFGPNTSEGRIGPSAREGLLSVKIGPGSIHPTQQGGGASHRGRMAPPNMEYAGCSSAALRNSINQFALGKTSSSVRTVKSPSTSPSPVFSAQFLPTHGSRTGKIGRRLEKERMTSSV